MRIEGKIAPGKQLGRTIGFPTANLQSCEALAPERYGVYAAWFCLEGRRLPCMVNIGCHPTLPGGPPTIEAHIFNFSENIYGMAAAVELVAFLREEQRFPSVAALQQQLELDKARSAAILKSEHPA